ncbi:MAG TPA: hypothetical protein VGB68_16345 [Pyrinomonadaceae bacterium]
MLLINIAVKSFSDSIRIHPGERLAQKNKETFIFNPEPHYLYKAKRELNQYFFCEAIGKRRSPKEKRHLPIGKQDLKVRKHHFLIRKLEILTSKSRLLTGKRQLLTGKPRLIVSKRLLIVSK